MSSPTTDTRALRRAQAGTTEATWLRNLLIGLALAFLLLFLVLPLAAMRRAHVVHGDPCTQHAAEHVGGKGLLPARQRHVGKGAARGHHTCIVDQAINTPCGLQHAIEQVLYLHLVGHVGLHGQGVMPQSCETLHQLLGRNRMAAPTESHAPTLLGRQQHGRRTNAPAATRDEQHRRIGARYA